MLMVLSLGKIVKVFDHGDENLTRVFVCKKVSERKKETLILSVYKETNANTFVTHALPSSPVRTKARASKYLK